MGVEIATGLQEAAAMMARIGHSRLPVYRESLDEVVGILYAMDLLRHVVRHGWQGQLMDILREPMMIPQSKPVSDLLAEFRARKVHIAVVLDEYGGMAGLVTLEDVLEEIVGDIRDEHEADAGQEMIVAGTDGWWLVQGRMPVEDFADHLMCDVDDDAEYDTLAGLVLDQLGHIPVPGEAFEWRGHRIVVQEATRTRVVALRVKPQASIETQA
jgi:magnesium and cobalt transporter